MLFWINKYIKACMFLGSHWLLMTFWIIHQHTDFCSTPWEELIYNAVVGFIYCFCYFNVQESSSRYRMIFFYILTIAENVVCAGFYLTYTKHSWTFTIFNVTLLSVLTLVGKWKKFPEKYFPGTSVSIFLLKAQNDNINFRVKI